MQPAEGAQGPIGKGLYPERHAVHPRTAIAPEPARFYAGRISLQRDLDARIDRPERGDLLKQRADGGRRHQRGRTATEKDAADRAARGKLGPVPQFAAVGGHKARLVDAARSDMTVKVAVGALGGAKRPMQIDAEGATRHR